MHPRYLILIMLAIMRMIQDNQGMSIFCYVTITHILFFDFICSRKLNIYDAIFLGLLLDYNNHFIFGISSICNLNIWLISKSYQKFFTTHNFIVLYAAFIICILQQIFILFYCYKVMGYQCSLIYLKSYTLAGIFSYPIAYKLYFDYSFQRKNAKK